MNEKIDSVLSRQLLIIPAFNEESNIQKVIREIKEDLDFVDVLVVDDCSTDRTLEIIKNIKGISYLSLPINLGYSGALQAGFKYAVDKGYDTVVQFDGDGQHIASEARKLIDLMTESNADIVIGSRFIAKKNYQHSFFRSIGTNMFRIIIKKISKQEITDPTSGFQVLSKKVFHKYAKMNQYPEYPDANLLIEMILENYTIMEHSVQMRNREHGISMHSGVLKPIKYMIKMVYAIALILLRGKKVAMRQQRSLN